MCALPLLSDSNRLWMGDSDVIPLTLATSAVL